MGGGGFYLKRQKRGDTFQHDNLLSRARTRDDEKILFFFQEPGVPNRAGRFEGHFRPAPQGNRVYTSIAYVNDDCDHAV